LAIILTNKPNILKYNYPQKSIPFPLNGAISSTEHKFEPNFMNRIKNGSGILYIQNGYVLHPNWIDDIIHSQAKIDYKKPSKTDCLFYKNSKIELSATEDQSY